MTCGEEVV